MGANADESSAVNIGGSTIPGGPQQTLPDDEETASAQSSRFEATDGPQHGAATAGEAQEGPVDAPPMSKNMLKRLKRQQQYEDRKEDRKRIRKEKKHERAARKRAEREEKAAEARAAGLDPAAEGAGEAAKPSRYKANPVPVAIILDCAFDEYMRDPEIVSLSSQVVRSYSQNRCCRYQAHLFVSSFGGRLKTRFEKVLSSNHKKWKGVYVMEEDFCEAAKRASELMAGPDGGEVIEPLRARNGKAADEEKERDPSVPTPEPEPDDVDQSVVYLSSESPYTLERLEPHTSYVIGGLVDRNREKGLCYRRAREMKVRTAKLPIGEYMAMQSRYVLTTNQVVEIMARWLECGSWAEAFLAVIPKRKGGTLKGSEQAEEHAEALDEEGAENTEANVQVDPAASTQSS